MNRLIVMVFVFLGILLIPCSIYAKNYDYPDNHQTKARLEKLADDYPQYAIVESLVTTAGDNEILFLSAGSGEISLRPAIVLVGGIEGDHLLGTELALRFIEKLFKDSGNPEIRELLDNHTFYVFPDMTPDASEQYFASLKYQRKGNANSSYTDRYGNSVEHPYNDLNGDGLITSMRIRDPLGEWKNHPEDSRLMVKASKAEGEYGRYNLFDEGIDISKEIRWDSPGVNFNKNFSFDYPVFTSGAGPHAVSENETRALASFLFDAKNIYAVVSFGPANNLSEPLVYTESKGTERIITGILKEDALVNKMVSMKYNEIAGNNVHNGIPGSSGDFFQWAYFHYGRHSFSTPGWQVPRTDSENSEEDKTPANIDDPEFKFLRWAESEGIEDVFIPWQEAAHPLMPDRDVEVGGIIPFVMNNPPFNMVEAIADDHYRFIIELADMRPVVEIVNLKTEKLGNDLYRVTAGIANTGIFPTVSQLGERLRWVQKTVVRLEPGNDQQVVSGRKIEVLPALQGNSSETRSWLIKGSGELVLKAGAENTGFEEVKIKL